MNSVKSTTTPRLEINTTNITHNGIELKKLYGSKDIEIIASGSDHLVVDASNVNLKVGDNVALKLNYGALNKCNGFSIYSESILIINLHILEKTIEENLSNRWG